jgi:hypothetical protein
VELEQVITLSADDKVRAQAVAVLSFARMLALEDRMHHYLKFIGD